jgi:ribose/xylose/arabinose/galactoside ABC-type transport system permease subunit
LFISGVRNNHTDVAHINSFWQEVGRGSLLILAASLRRPRNRLAESS